MSTFDPRTCTGCGEPLGVIDAQRWDVCLECTRARQRAVLSGRCACGRRALPGSPVTQAGRRWVPCRRCLGAIRSRGVA